MVASFALLAFWWAAIVGPPGLVEHVTSDVLRSTTGQDEAAKLLSSLMVRSGFDQTRAPELAREAVSDPHLVSILDTGAGATRSARADEAVRVSTSQMAPEDADAVAASLAPLLKSAAGWGEKIDEGPIRARTLHSVLVTVAQVGFAVAAALAVYAFASSGKRANVARRVGRWSFRASIVPVAVIVLGPLLLRLAPFEWSGLGVVVLRSAGDLLLTPLLGLLAVGLTGLVTAWVLKHRAPQT